MQSGHEDTLEERYTIKLCFKLGKNTTETYGMLQTAFQPSRDDGRCGRSKEVNTPELIGQTVRLTMLRF